MMDFLTFCLSENIFILLPFLEDMFTGYKILGWQRFFFSTLKVSFNCFGAFIVHLLLLLVRYPLLLLLSIFFLHIRSLSVSPWCAKLGIYLSDSCFIGILESVPGSFSSVVDKSHTIFVLSFKIPITYIFASYPFFCIFHLFFFCFSFLILDTSWNIF